MNQKNFTATSNCLALVLKDEWVSVGRTHQQALASPVNTWMSHCRDSRAEQSDRNRSEHSSALLYHPPFFIWLSNRGKAARKVLSISLNKTGNGHLLTKSFSPPHQHSFLHSWSAASTACRCYTPGALSSRSCSCSTSSFSRSEGLHFSKRNLHSGGWSHPYGSSNELLFHCGSAVVRKAVPDNLIWYIGYDSPPLDFMTPIYTLEFLISSNKTATGCPVQYLSWI